MAKLKLTSSERKVYEVGNVDENERGFLLFIRAFITNIAFKISAFNCNQKPDINYFRMVELIDNGK